MGYSYPNCSGARPINCKLFLMLVQNELNNNNFIDVLLRPITKIVFLWGIAKNNYHKTYRETKKYWLK